MTKVDAAFIAHAREDVPYLLALLDRARQALRNAVAHGAGNVSEIKTALVAMEEDVDAD